MPSAKPFRLNFGQRGTVLGALLRAVPVFFSARILALVLAPMAAVTVIWFGIAWMVWEPTVDWLSRTIFSWSDSLGPVAASIFVAMLLLVTAVITALVAIAVLAMPLIVDTVARRDFVNLERRRGGTLLGSLGAALRALGRYAPLWLLALPLLVFPPAFIIANVVLNAWLNRELLPYDALAEHADRDELELIIASTRGRLFVLALIIAPLSLVPFVNFFASLFTGIAFTYLCLDELVMLRRRTAAVRNAAALEIGRLP